MANKYWVAGGNGNWSSTTNWSLASGGSSGAAVAGSADVAIFNSSSGSGTATVDSSVTIQQLTMTGFAGTLAFGTNTISLNSLGNVFTGDTTYNVTGTPLLISTYTGGSSRTWTMGAVSETKSISVNISAGAGNVSISGNVRNLIFSGSFTGVYRDNANTFYGDLTFKTGMSIQFVTSASTRTFAGTGAVGNSVQKITSAALNLDFPITFSGTSIYQLQDALSVGTSSLRTITLTTGTLDLNNFTLTHYGNFSSNNSNTRTIAFGSSGVINITRVGTATFWDCATITNFARTGTPSVKFTGSATTLTVQHGTTAGGSEGNSMSFAFGSNPTVVLASTNWVLDLELLSGSNITLSGGATNPTIYGGYKGATNSFGNITFASTNATIRNIYLGATSSGQYFTFDGVGGSWQLSANSFIENVVLTRGSFSTNGYTLNTNQLSFSSATTKTLTINSTVNLYKTGFIIGSIGGTGTGTTANLSGSIIRYTASGVYAVTGVTFPSVVYDGATGGSIDFNTSTSVTSLTTNFACSIIIEPAVILSVVNLSLYGDATNHGKITAGTDPASQGFISKPSGTVTVSYQDITYISAIGGATWLAPTTNGNVDGGNNTGWIFGAYSANNSNFLAFF
jgi:hypothetical protein